MRVSKFLGIAVALFGVLALSVSAGDSGKKRVNLEVLKRLAGDWVRVDENGAPTQEVISSFRLVGAGTAVVETLFGGTDHEMVSVYHHDGDDLVLSHYCVEGNQPKMKAAKISTPQQVVFECQGGSNMDSEADQHMHQGKITFLGKDRIQTEWLRFHQGQHNYTASYTLMRKAD